MYGILGGRFAIIVSVADVCSIATIRDQLKELDLFDRYSFDISRGFYVIYLKTIDTDNYESLYSLVRTNNYRLVRIKD